MKLEVKKRRRLGEKNALQFAATFQPHHWNDGEGVGLLESRVFKKIIHRFMSLFQKNRVNSYSSNEDYFFKIINT